MRCEARQLPGRGPSARGLVLAALDGIIPSCGSITVGNAIDLRRMFRPVRRVTPAMPVKEDAMKHPEYVTVEEVRRVCRELNIRDWSALTDDNVQMDEAATILAAMNVQGMDIDTKTFREGLVVELEHGTRFADANVTNNHPILTGMIVLAHLKESMDYYARLDVAEIEGDMLKAAVAGDAAKLAAKYAKLVAARRTLSQDEAGALT